MNDSPIVVLAVPRSGSNLLRALLNRHEQVFVAAHSDLLLGLLNPEVLRAPERLQRLVTAEFDRTRRNLEDVLAALRELLHGYWTRPGRPGTPAEQWGFLLYDLSLVTTLTLVAPSARLVHIVRDGRDVVASFWSNWSFASSLMPVPRRDHAEIARLWVASVRAAEQAGAHTLRLEDLANAATRAGTVAQLLAHLGLPASAAVEGFSAQLPRVNAEVSTPDRWKRELDDATQSALSRVPGFDATLARLGYSR